MEETCEICDKKYNKKCGNCKTARYCSLECQLKDWPKHKLECRERNIERLRIKLEKSIERLRLHIIDEGAEPSLPNHLNINDDQMRIFKKIYELSEKLDYQFIKNENFFLYVVAILSILSKDVDELVELESLQSLLRIYKNELNVNQKKRQKEKFNINKEEMLEMMGKKIKTGEIGDLAILFELIFNIALFLNEDPSSHLYKIITEISEKIYLVLFALGKENDLDIFLDDVMKYNLRTIAQGFINAEHLSSNNRDLILARNLHPKQIKQPRISRDRQRKIDEEKKAENLRLEEEERKTAKNRAKKQKERARKSEQKEKQKGGAFSN